MSRPKILIFAPREEPGDPRAIDEAGYDIVPAIAPGTSRAATTKSAFVAAARDAVAMMGTSIRATPISRRVMEASQRLRIVAKYTVGVDDIDVEAATDLGILVCHAPTEANCFGVAESTMAAMLTLLKKVRERDAAVRAGLWREPYLSSTYIGSRQSDGYPGITVGLVGLGRIGTRVAQLLAPWRVRIIACDPYIEPARFLLAGAERVDYDTLLRRVGRGVVPRRAHAGDARHVLGARAHPHEARRVLINTARGKVIDEAALARAIADGHIAGAAIDAFEDEPLPADSPLRTLGDKVLLSPHSASFNEGGSCAPASPGRPARCWRRSPARCRTTSTTRTRLNDGNRDLAGFVSAQRCGHSSGATFGATVIACHASAICPLRPRGPALIIGPSGILQTRVLTGGRVGTIRARFRVGAFRVRID